MKNNVQSTEESSLSMKQNIAYNSSAIFYVLSGKQIDTKISFLNHYLLKRNIQNITACITFRSIEGKLVKELFEEITEPQTYSFSTLEIVGEFEGSCEIEFFSSSNVVIPFTAVVAVYEMLNSVCQIHSISRVYSKREMTYRKFTVGEEAGWTCRDSPNIKSVAYLHNGFTECHTEVKAEVINFKGETASFSFHLVLKPYETFKLIPQEYFDIVSFLNGLEGHISVSFNTETSFPRFACGNYYFKDESIIELQLTHSNFNYSIINTPRLESGDFGLISSPYFRDDVKARCVIYPNYMHTEELFLEEFELSSELLNLHNIEKEFFKVKSEANNGIPNRLVTGIILDWEYGNLPSECSTGIITKGYISSNKHWYWGLCFFDDFKSYLSIKVYNEILECNENKEAELILYDNEGVLYKKRILLKSSKFISFDDLPREIQGIVWYVIKSDYPLITVFSVMEHPSGSGCIEHSF